MHVFISHTSVRVHPELVVEVTAVIDGKAVRVSLERDAIKRLLGPDIADEEALSLSLQNKLETIRIAIEAYLLACGIPMDRYLVLAWHDLSGS